MHNETWEGLVAVEDDELHVGAASGIASFGGMVDHFVWVVGMLGHDRHNMSIVVLPDRSSRQLPHVGHSNDRVGGEEAEAAEQ